MGSDKLIEEEQEDEEHPGSKSIVISKSQGGSI
jgi:hypothetical protein